MGMVFPLNFVIWKIWQTFPKIRKLLKILYYKIYLSGNFPNFVCQEKTKFLGIKKSLLMGGYGKSLLLNPANYTSNL